MLYSAYFSKLNIARCYSQNLADQLTLSQPGGQIMPPNYYWHPQIFWPSDGSGLGKDVGSESPPNISAFDSFDMKNLSTKCFNVVPIW